MSLVDSHCHLDFDQYEEDIDAVMARAGEAGVATMVTIGTRLSTFPKVLAVAERYDNVFCTVGIHPHEAQSEAAVTAAALLEVATHPKVVGFGETGLDYFYDHSPRDVQRTQFRTHIEASRQSGLPLVVHTRDAEDDTIAILTEESGKGAFPGVIHCFSGTGLLAEAALSLGFYISVSGIVTFNKAEDLRQVVAKVPLERLLVETDSPYLAPMPFRGKRNEPAFVARTAARLAEIKGVPVAEIERWTTENFFTLFSKARQS